MSRWVLFLAIGCCLASWSSATHSSRGGNWFRELFLQDVNGGTTCAACSVLTGLTQQLSEVHNVSIAEALDMLCRFLPEEVQGLCASVIGVVAPFVIELLEAKETPDVTCYAIGLCRNDTGDFCHLFPLPKHGGTEREMVLSAKKKISTPLPDYDAKKKLFYQAFIDFCDVWPIEAFCEAFNNHTPLEDEDRDYFSTYGTVRGYFWRGKECNDHNKDIYPGRHTVDDANADTNCNGIFGVEPNSGQTYESLWCSGSQQMGTIVLGDSASAHFHIPPSWVTSREMSKEAFKDLLLVLENEFDWPMMSIVTGFMNSSWPASISGKVDSTYLRLLELNRCNHRDYQNIGVNGARVKDMAKEIVQSFARHSDTDNPVFLSLALIGNDVCNGHPGMEHMTKPDDFYKFTLETLKYVDEHVAPGSTVMGTGLVDGRALFDLLGNRVHPVGSLHSDVTYSQFYDYFNCLQISPCFGWMNSNETWRNRTTERAMELNKAFKRVVAENQFTNFSLHYMDPPLAAVIDRWEKMGRDPAELIEPVDGFHPSQIGDALTTELTFEMLVKMEGVLPKENPFNDKIKEKFGDQGGYL